MINESAIITTTAEIIDCLPVPMRGNDEIIQGIVEELQQGIEPYKVRVAAIEAAHRLLEQKVDTGFILVNKELNEIKHSVEVDRIHAQYAKQSALEAKQSADQALAKIHEVATVAAVASAKADGAKDIAKSSRWANFDPLTGMTLCAVGIIALIGVTSIKVQPVVKEESKGSTIRCGVDVSCTYDDRPRPIPARGGI